MPIAEARSLRVSVRAVYSYAIAAAGFLASRPRGEIQRISTSIDDTHRLLFPLAHAAQISIVELVSRNNSIVQRRRLIMWQAEPAFVPLSCRMLCFYM